MHWGDTCIIFAKKDMKLHIDLALKHAKQYFGKTITRQKLAEAMWPESNHPYLNLYNLERGYTNSITMEQIGAIINLTGVPVNILIQ